MPTTVTPHLTTGDTGERICVYLEVMHRSRQTKHTYNNIFIVQGWELSYQHILRYILYILYNIEMMTEGQGERESKSMSS